MTLICLSGKREDNGQAKTIKSQDFCPTAYPLIKVFFSFKFPISLLNPFFFSMSSPSSAFPYPSFQPALSSSSHSDESPQCWGHELIIQWLSHTQQGSCLGQCETGSSVTRPQRLPMESAEQVDR